MVDEFRRDLACGAGTLWPSGGSRPGLLDLGRVLFHSPGLQALFVYRVGRWLQDAPTHRWRGWVSELLRPVHALAAAYVRLGFDIDLHLSADVGPGLQIFHFGGIRLVGCQVGSNCVIHQQVTIEPGPDGRAARLGDRVWVGPHARIIGGVSIGDGATIGTAAVVRGDVPPNAVVVGDPARTIRVAYDNSELRNRV